MKRIHDKGIRSVQFLEAIGTVRREAFVAAEFEELAYRDGPLPIGHEQTISQPFVVALMADALMLKPTDRVLDVGTGSGYAAEVLSLLCAEVYSIERVPKLADTAKARLTAEGYINVHVRCGDGTLGWPEQAPFDAICVAAGSRNTPLPLREQILVGGRLVIPLGESKSPPILSRITRLDEANLDHEELGDVRFVPMIGANGWDETSHRIMRDPRNLANQRRKRA